MSAKAEPPRSSAGSPAPEPANTYHPLPASSKVLGDFSCGYVKGAVAINGRLFIGEKHVAFRAQFFGSDTTVLIPAEEVVSIQKRNTALLLPNAILISTRDSKCLFNSFLQRDQAYSVLQGMLQANGVSVGPSGDTPYSSEDVSDESDDVSDDDASSSSRRAPSPTPMGRASLKDSGFVIVPPERAPMHRSVQSTLVAPAFKSPQIGHERTRSDIAHAAASAPVSPAAPSSSASASASATPVQQPLAPAVVVTPADAPREPQQQPALSSAEPEAPQQQQQQAAQEAAQAAPPSPAVAPEVPLEPLPEMSGGACGHGKKVDGEKHVTTESMAVSPARFFELYLSNKSRWWESVMEATGCTEVASDGWQTAVCGCFTRKIVFTKPITHPLSTKKAAKGVCTSFTLTHLSSGELVFDQLTVCGKDVPYGDYFVPRNCWRVTQGPAPDSCVINVDMSVNFTKYTMLRSVIEKTALSEMTQFVTDMLIRMRARLAQARLVGENAGAQAKPEAAIEPAAAEEAVAAAAAVPAAAVAPSMPAAVTAEEEAAVGPSQDAGGEVPARMWVVLALLTVLSVAFLAVLYLKVSAQSRMIGDAWVAVSDASERLEAAAQKLGVGVSDEWRSRMDQVGETLESTRGILRVLEALAHEQHAAVAEADAQGGWLKVVAAVVSTSLALLLGCFCTMRRAVSQ
eukprot:m51a1_g6789 hypothetical protein (686) ;mRNA; r:190898-193605